MTGVIPTMTGRPRSSRQLALATLLALSAAGVAAASTALNAAASSAVVAESSDWTLRDIVDPRSGDEVSAPSGRNPRGFGLDFLRAESGEVLGFFRLPAGDRDFLDATKPPLLALDGAPQQSVLLLEGGLTWAAFPVWSGEGDAAGGLLRDLMQGTRVEVTYFLHGGGYKTTEIDLEGAAPILAEAFGIPERLSPEEIATARELETAIEQAGAACLELKKKKRERCLEVARSCRERATTAAELRVCIDAAAGD